MPGLSCPVYFMLWFQKTFLREWMSLKQLQSQFLLTLHRSSMVFLTSVKIKCICCTFLLFQISTMTFRNDAWFHSEKENRHLMYGHMPSVGLWSCLATYPGVSLVYKHPCTSHKCISNSSPLGVNPVITTGWPFKETFPTYNEYHEVGFGQTLWIFQFDS